MEESLEQLQSEQLGRLTKLTDQIAHHQQKEMQLESVVEQERRRIGEMQREIDALKDQRARDMVSHEDKIKEVYELFREIED